MKKSLIILCTTFSLASFAQVAIGKSEITKLPDNVTPNPGISLEFGPDTTEKKGVVVPWVNGTSNTSPYIIGYTGTNTIVDGTIVYDTGDHKVKYKKSGAWFDLSVDANGTTNTSLQDSKTELINAKAAIGTNSDKDTTPGILVLTDTDKAMILPKVAEPHLNIKNPAAGMMVYDKTNRQLAIFNGTNWTFWKP